MTATSGLTYDDLNDPVCLHKGDDEYKTRVGWCCHRCGFIRHRHSVLVFVPLSTVGGIPLSSTAAVSISALFGGVG